MTTTQKQAIIQSLDGMNTGETDKLIRYIRSLLYNPRNDIEYLRRRNRGMREIRTALKEASAF